MKTEILSPFSKLYKIAVDSMTTMRQMFNDAWQITCDYTNVKITTCTDGWACIEGGELSMAEAMEMEARLDKVFS